MPAGTPSGRPHGAAVPADYVGAELEGADMQDQGFGWKNKFGKGFGADTIGCGLEVTWTQTPTKWSNNFFNNLFGFEWELAKSPAGAHQWTPKNGTGNGTVPDAHYPYKASRAIHVPTTDLALGFDPAYEKISRRFHEHPDHTTKAIVYELEIKGANHGSPEDWDYLEAKSSQEREIAAQRITLIRNYVYAFLGKINPHFEGLSAWSVCDNAIRSRRGGCDKSCDSREAEKYILPGYKAYVGKIAQF